MKQCMMHDGSKRFERRTDRRAYNTKLRARQPVSAAPERFSPDEKNTRSECQIKFREMQIMYSRLDFNEVLPLRRTLNGANEVLEKDAASVRLYGTPLSFSPKLW